MLGRNRHRRTQILPHEETIPGWYAILPPPLPPRRLCSQERADCAIIGAGFTGLAAAHRLAELRPDWRIIILEGQRVGLGASGRSSGFVVDFANNSAWTDPGVQRKAVRVNREGFAHLRAMVKKMGIETHWSEVGWLHTVATAKMMPLLKNLMDLLDKWGEPFEQFDRERLRCILGTDHYYAALRIPGGAMVQPAALVRALAEHLPKGIELFEESAVRSVAQGSRLRLETGEGAVDADRLILAANGFSPLLGFLRQRVFPLLTFSSMTRSLTPEERKALRGKPEWGLIAQEMHGSSVRRTRDHRILIRNTVHYSRDLRVDPEVWESVTKSHCQAFRERFPMLPEVTFEFCWSGILGVTRNRLPYFGELDRNVFTSAGYSGAGIAMGVATGRLLAELITGANSQLLQDMLKLPQPAWLPPEPLLGPIIRFRLVHG